MGNFFVVIMPLKGGGMDQTTVMMAKDGLFCTKEPANRRHLGAALRINFDPLQTTRVELPANALFAVLHCGVESNKAAASHYNERVAESRIASQILFKKQTNATFDEWRQVRRVRDFQERAKLSLDQCSGALDRHLNPEKEYSRERVLRELEIEDAQLREYSLNSNTQTSWCFDPDFF